MMNESEIYIESDNNAVTDHLYHDTTIFLAHLRAFLGGCEVAGDSLIQLSKRKDLIREVVVTHPLTLDTLLAVIQEFGNDIAVASLKILVNILVMFS